MIKQHFPFSIGQKCFQEYFCNEKTHLAPTGLANCKQVLSKSVLLSGFCKHSQISVLAVFSNKRFEIMFSAWGHRVSFKVILCLTK